MEHVCIAAPRPVRLYSTPAVPPSPSSPSSSSSASTSQSGSPAPLSRPRIVEALARFTLSDDDLPSDPPVPSPTLPEEALQEFLAILRPHAQVHFVSHNRPPSSLRRYQHHHASSFSSSSSSSSTSHPYKLSRKTSSTDKSRRGLGKTETNVTSDFGSPISRTHTRNPLPRHPAYETLSSNLIFTMASTPPPRVSNNPFPPRLSNNPMPEEGKTSS